MLINSPNISGSLTVTGNTVITGSLAAGNTVIAGGLTAGTVTSGAVTATGLFVETGSSFGGALNLRQATGFSLWSGAPYTSIYATTGNRVIFNFSNDNRTFTLDGSLVSSASPRTFTFPDATGTFALTNQIGSFSVSGSTTLVGNTVVTGSFTVTTGSNVELQVTNTGVTLGNISTDIHNVTGSFNVSGSTRLNGNTAVTGSLTVTGQVVAQTLNVQQVTSSIVYSSGSNIFGNSLANTQQFTGSLQVSGSSHNILGNVGVGIAIPTNPLHIQSNTLSQLNVTALSGNTNAQINLEPTGTGIALIGPANNVDLAFRTNASIKLRLDKDGNLGLGVTPSAWNTTSRALQLSSFISLSQQHSGALNLMSYALETSANTFTYADTGVFPSRLNMNPNDGTITLFGAGTGTSGNAITWASRLAFTSAGAATFGSSVTAQSIKIENTAAAAFLYFNNTASPASNYIALGSAANELYFQVNGSDRMIIKSNGNVGIGTTTPSERLHLRDTTTGYVGLRLEGTAPYAGSDWTIYASSVTENSANDFLGFYNNSTTDGATTGYKLRIFKNGNIGIGTDAPVAALHVSNVPTSFFGIIETTGTSAGTVKHFRVHKPGYVEYGIGILADNSFHISTASTFPTTNGFTITSAGNVGIGITPSYLLHIPQNNNIFLSNLYITGTANNPVLSSGATGGSMSLEGGGVEQGKIYLQGAGSGGNGYIEFYAGGSLRMTISDNGSIGAPSGTNIYNPSDLRLKRNISTISNGLDKISALNPIKFNWIDGFEPSEDGKDMLGFVAQEVYEVIPEAVESFSGNSILVNDIEIENPLRINEKFIIPVLVKAIQELKAENDILKSRIDTLEQA